MATTALNPDGILLIWIISIIRVSTSGLAGVFSTYAVLSIRLSKFVTYIPIACFACAHWYVFLGDWLCSGNGMHDARTPKIVLGWISQCVFNLMLSASAFTTKSDGFIAIIDHDCSSGSIYSIIELSILQLVKRSSHVRVFLFNRSMISFVMRTFLSFTRKTGRVNLPLSLQTRISFIL